MHGWTAGFLLGITLLAGTGATVGAAEKPPPPITPQQLVPVIRKLQPLHLKLGRPGPMDWLAQHEEPGQTFAEYVASRPTRPQGKRHVIYIQPLGTFTPEQEKVLTLTSEFMGLYYNLPVKTLAAVPLSKVPASARREHPAWHIPQILTTYVLDDLLIPKLPADAAAYIAFTASDLWPGKGWNFVFGQASLEERVGVWSIYRNGDPAESQDAFMLCLLRTMKTAVHETGHMFGMYHCIAYECCMCGSNHREESDKRPLWLCPECVAKVCWATNTAPVARYQRLAEFCEKNGLKPEAEYYRKAIKALTP